MRFWDGLSFALGPVPLRVLGTVAAVAAAVKRNVRAALVLMACGPLNGIVTSAAKALANRPRPPTMLVPTPSTSFPSGHALEATALLLALLAFGLPMVGRALGRVAIALTALCLLAVGAASGAQRALPVGRAGRLGTGIPVFPVGPLRISALPDGVGRGAEGHGA